MKEKQIVITGAAGFIGSCLVRHLNDLGFYNLLLVDDLKCREKWKNLVGKRFLNLISKEEIFNYLSKEQDIGTIFHLGACSNTLEEDADFLLNNNFRFSIKLFEYAFKNKKRFIYASSAATYGDGSNGFSDDEKKLYLLKPNNKYGYSKHLFDLWLYDRDLLSKAVGLKYFNVFGPNEYHKEKMASPISRMVKEIEERGAISLYKSTHKDYRDGEQKRDFIYVKEAVVITASFLNNRLSGIFNVGRGEGVTWNFLATAVFKALGREPKIEYVDMPLTLAEQYQNFTCADMSKYKPEVKKWGIEEAVKDYIQNYLLKGALKW